MRGLDYNVLESSIGYTFSDKKLLTMSMTHSSYANEHRINKLLNNERLEFLGDAVLEIVTSEFLYLKFPHLPEGRLTKLRASIVCEQSLYYCAREINLGQYILLGKGEERCGGRDKESIISDCLEALIGAIFLDGGFTNVKEFTLKFILNDIEEKQLFYDSKTILQEYVQSMHDNELTYELVSSNGPDHNKEFIVNAVLGGRIMGKGAGRSKKSAEQEAAYDAIKKIKGLESGR